MNTHRILVLDAMGVIYPVGDDVRDLLCPFVHEQGGETDDTRIASLYREASLGRLSARDFWQAVRLDPGLEDSYLSRFALTAGFRDFLDAPPSCVAGLWCLSNDVSEWSLGLRRRFDLESRFQGFVISGDVGLRKPDPGIYQHLVRRTGAEPQQMIFVDDRPANLNAARALGMETVLFTLVEPPADTAHMTARGFAELHAHLFSLP